MNLSIVIVTWNCLRQVRNCIESLNSIGLEDFETIVIDSNSDDGTREYLEKMTKSALVSSMNLRFVPLTQASNWSAANQIGLELSRGDWIAFSNPDIVFSRGFKDMVAYASAFKEPYPFVSCQLIYPDGKYQYPNQNLNYLNIFGMFTTLGLVVDRALFRGFIRRHFTYNTDNWRGVRAIEHPVASLFLVNRKTIEDKMGGRLWRSGYTQFCSDSDMFRKGQELGVSALFVSDIKIVHERGYSVKATSTKRTEFEMAYGATLYARYWSSRPLLLSFLYFLDSVWSPVFLFLRRGGSLSDYVETSAARLQGVVRAWKLQIS